MNGPNLKMNFLGVSVADFSSAYLYYTGVLGVRRAPSDHHEENWAMLGKTWEEHLALGTSGMMWELFGNAPPPPTDRAWGRGQNIRPGIQVENVEMTLAELRGRNVKFNGGIERREWGEMAEIIGAEGTRWSVGKACGFPYGQGLHVPHIGWVEIKAANIDGQVAFYRDVMGLQTVFHTPEGAMLRQNKDEPIILIEPGGEKISTDLSMPASPLRQHPVWISAMMSEPDEVAAWFERHEVNILKPLTRHPDWGGDVMIITDVDGNGIEVVRYDHMD